MDVLTEVLDTLRMEGSLYFPTDFTSPWGLDVPADNNVCRFHVVTQGRCWITVPAAGASRLLSQGDLALVPHGNRHLLQDRPETTVEGLNDVLAATEYPGDGVLEWGAGGERTRMVCGYFAFDKEVVHPLIDGLPPLLHVPASPGYDFGWMDHLVRFIATETAEARPGARAIASRLSEILFIQSVRYQSERATETVPFLRTLVDERLGRAVRAIHARPAHDWTLETLAQEAGMSRTAFSQAFSESMGMTATDYLTFQRMQEARQLLAADLSAEQVAPRVGYRSEAAFARRFKRFFGEAPGAYRRRRVRPG